MAFRGKIAAAPGTKVKRHDGAKGSQTAPMHARKMLTNSGAMQPGATINNYAKATPAANPTPPAPNGLGSGTWPGIGM